MVPTRNESTEGENEESKGSKARDQTPPEISVFSLLTHGKPHKKRLQNESDVPRTRLLQFPSASFRRIAEGRDEISRSVPSPSPLGIRERLNGFFYRKLDWASLMKMSKEWIRNPKNMALFVWMLCVNVSGGILFFVMTGVLDKAIPDKSQRNVWFEVNNQILNALFTLMCLYQHPKRFHNLVLLCRWTPDDISRLRKIYCKNGTYKPHEWAHMMVVVLLLHLNCFAQYALCGLNLGYKRSNRPAIGVGICISVAIAAPAIAGVYSSVSPLGKDYDSEVDEEAHPQRSDQLQLVPFEKKYSFVVKQERSAVERPEWSGWVIDFCNDVSLAYLSLFCSFCVFGWNMERLGLGNMYVHILTFSLFCFAPSYDIVENKLCRKKLSVSPLGNDNGENHFRSAPSSPLEFEDNVNPFSTGSSVPGRQQHIVEVDYVTKGKDGTTTTPPTPAVIERDA